MPPVVFNESDGKLALKTPAAKKEISRRQSSLPQTNVNAPKMVTYKKHYALLNSNSARKARLFLRHKQLSRPSN